MNDKNEIDKTINNMIKSLGSVYLGDWLIDCYDNELLKEEIHSRADQELYQILQRKRSVQRANRVLVLSFIYVSMDNYDGGFYDHFESYYRKCFEGYKIQLISKKIREVIADVFKESVDNSARIINQILIQTFIPRNFLKDFFEFIFDIYRFNYDCDISLYLENSEERIDLIENLKVLFLSLFSGDEDNSPEKRIRTNNQYKTYVLIKSTREALSNPEIIDAVLPIILEILRMIEEDYYFDESYINEAMYRNSYFQVGFEDWKKNKNYGYREHKKIHKENSNKNILRPYFSKYDYSKNLLYLKTRTHFIMDYKSSDKIQVVVYDDRKILCCVNQLELFPAVNGVKIRPQEISLSVFSDRFRYTVLLNDQVIYDSKDALYKSYLVFSNIGEIITSNSKYEGNAFILTTDVLKNEEFKEQRFQDYFVYMGRITNQTDLQIGSELITRRKMVDNELIGEEVSSVNCTDKQGFKIKVYCKLPKIHVKSRGIDVNKWFINVNNKNVRLNINNIIVNKNEVDSFTILLDNIIFRSGIYQIIVKGGSTVTLNRHEFIYDHSLNVEEISNSYGNYIRTISSDFFDRIETSQLIKELTSESISSLVKEFKLEDKLFTYFFSPKIAHYSIGIEYYSFLKYIWLADLVDEPVFINVNSIKTITLYQDKKEIAKSHFESINENQYELSKELLNNHLTSDTNQFIVKISTHDSRSYNLNILNRNQIDEKATNVFKESGNFFFNVQFIGRNNLSIEIKNENNVTIYQCDVNEPGIIEIPLLEDTQYDIRVFEGSTNIFDKIQRKQVYSKSYKRPSMQSIIESEISIIEAYLDEYSDAKQIKHTYIDGLSMTNNMLTGKLYFTDTVLTKHYPRNTNPVNIELLEELVYENDSNSVIRTLVAMTDYEGDGLLLSNRGFHLDYTNNKKLNDVYKFKILIKGRKRNG